MPQMRKASRRKTPDGTPDLTADVEALGIVLRALRTAVDARQAARAALDAVRTAFDWTYGSYWEVDHETRTLRFASDSGHVSQDFRDVTREARFARGVGMSGRAWDESGLVVVEDLEQVKDCVRARAARQAGVKAGVCFPITVSGDVVATMDFFTLERMNLSHARKETLRNVGELVSSTFARIREQEEQRKQVENARAVATVLEAMGRADDLANMVAATLEAVRSAFSWHYGSYWARDRSLNVLRFSAESGDISPAFARITRESVFTQGTGVNGRAWAQRELVAIEDLGKVSDCVRAPAARQAGVRSGVCFPIIARGEVIGTMDFFSTGLNEVGESRIEALRSVAQLVSSAAERFLDRGTFTSGLKEFSQALDASTVGLTATVRDQSTGAQELAASVGEVSATLGELRETSAETLERAERVINSAHLANQASSSGAHAVERAIESMRSIREQVARIAERILLLNEQTSQIGDIVASVSEIAAQSRLLALNASIESARAGDAGRGFAVVAREMASLAEQSRAATKRVTQILGQIQAGTNAAVVSAEEGTKKAELGMVLAEHCGENILKLSRVISESSASARLIANSARQQNAGIQDVADALVQISNATASTAAGLRQTQDATAQLAALSSRIQLLLRKYVHDATEAPGSDEQEQRRSA